MVEERDIALTAEHLARIGSRYGPTIAHDSRAVAFVTALAGSPQIWTVPATGGFPQQVTALDDPVTHVAWSPTADRLAFAVAPGGGMHTQVYVCRPDGTGLRRLTNGAAATHALNGWTRDGAALRISANRRDSAAFDAYLLDPDTGSLRRLRAADGYATLLDSDPTGRRAIESRQRERGDNDMYLLDLRAGGATLLTPHRGAGSSADARFAPDGRAIYFAVGPVTA